MTSSWSKERFKSDKILKILKFLGKFYKLWKNLAFLGNILVRFKILNFFLKKFQNFARCPGKRDAQIPSEMPRQTRCPDAQRDAQANEMPRCPGKRDAQMPSEMPRCHMRCPDVKSVWASGQICIWAYWVWASGLASGPIESGHLGKLASWLAFGYIESWQVYEKVFLQILNNFFMNTFFKKEIF